MILTLSLIELIMFNCNHFWINYDLYNRLGNLANPCNAEWHGKLTFAGKGSIGNTYRAPIVLKGITGLRDYYIIKVLPVNERSTAEKHIMQKISDDLFIGKAPLLFPFLYLTYVCENTLSMVMQPADISLAAVISQHHNIEWWVEVLYQLSKAVYYLEEQLINHNDLTFENVMFQHLGKDYKEIVLMLIDFGSAVIGKGYSGLSFILGRDLNYFLYILIYNGVPNGYFPKALADQIHPFLLWEEIPPLHGEHPYLHGLRKTSIKHQNWRTSGKYFSRWLATMYPFVTDRCTPQILDKLYGVGFGAVIGDALGMPIEFDYTHKTIVKKMYPSAEFEGLSAAWKLPPGTFTDDTQMALALTDAILSEDRTLVPRTVAREFKKWGDSKPIDIGIHTAAVFSIMRTDGSNWQDAAFTVYSQKPDSAANGATMRTWPIPILHHADSHIAVMDSAIKQAQTTHMNTDATYAAVFVSCLIHKLINGGLLNKSITECLVLIKDSVTPGLYDAIHGGHLLAFNKLNGGHGWIVHTMTVVMWAIRNTSTFRDALICSANVHGDTDTNASITGGIAGALYGFDMIPEEWVKVFNEKNKWNFWAGEQVTEPRLKDIIATLAQC